MFEKQKIALKQRSKKVISTATAFLVLFSGASAFPSLQSFATGESGGILTIDSNSAGSGTGWAWTDGSTLTLSGASFDGLVLKKPATIVLEGVNVINGQITSDDNCGVKITGSGSLDINSAASKSAMSVHSLTMDSGYVKISGEGLGISVSGDNGGQVTVNGGYLEVTGKDYGIYASKYTQYGGSVKATATDTVDDDATKSGKGGVVVFGKMDIYGGYLEANDNTPTSTLSNGTGRGGITQSGTSNENFSNIDGVVKATSANNHGIDSGNKLLIAGGVTISKGGSSSKAFRSNVAFHTSMNDSSNKERVWALSNTGEASGEGTALTRDGAAFTDKYAVIAKSVTLPIAKDYLNGHYITGALDTTGNVNVSGGSYICTSALPFINLSGTGNTLSIEKTLVCASTVEPLFSTKGVQAAKLAVGSYSESNMSHGATFVSIGDKIGTKFNETTNEGNIITGIADSAMGKLVSTGGYIYAGGNIYEGESTLTNTYATFNGLVVPFVGSTLTISGSTEITVVGSCGRVNNASVIGGAKYTALAEAQYSDTASEYQVGGATPEVLVYKAIPAAIKIDLDGEMASAYQYVEYPTFEEGWNYLVANATADTRAELLKEVTADETTHSFGTGAGFKDGAILVPADKEIYFSMGSYTIDRGLTKDTAIANGSVFVIEGKLRLSARSGRPEITGGATTGNGGGVFVANGGTFENDASIDITNCYAAENGGGVFLDENANFSTKSARIRTNTAKNGAGVYISENATMDFYGGSSSLSGVDSNEIIRSSGGHGGGIYMNGTLKISGTSTPVDSNTFYDEALSQSVADNVYLPTGKVITIENTNSSGGHMGVRTQVTPTETAPVPITTTINADLSELFSSDFGINSGIEAIDIATGADHVVHLGIQSDEMTYTVAAGDNVPAGITSSAVTEITLSGTIGNGTAPYTYTKESGPAWIKVSADGKITGTRPDTDTAASTATIKVTDSTGKYTTFDITIGAVTANAFTASFNPNGGTGEMAASTEANAPACTFTAPSGKQFKEWNTQADGSGTSYAVNAALGLTADTTLYAIWEDESGIKAEISDAVITGAKGAAIAEKEITVTLTGDTFKAAAAGADVTNWFTNIPAGLTAKLKTALTDGSATATIVIDGTPTATSSGAITIAVPAESLVGGNAITATANANAKWNITDAAAKSIFYLRVGGDGSMNASRTGDPLSACTFTAPEGKIFKNWNTMSDGTGTSYNPGDVIDTASVTAEELVLYAIWGVEAADAVIEVINGIGGMVSPNGTVTVADGGSQTFTMTPAAGWKVKDIIINGRSTGSTLTEYSLSMLHGNMTFEVQFEEIGDAANINADVNALDFGYFTLGYSSKTLPLTFTNSGNLSGKITAVRLNGTDFATDFTNEIVLEAGNSATINVTFLEGKTELKDYADTLTLTIDGREITISLKAVVTDKNTFVISAKKGENGTVSPFGEVGVLEGGDKTFTFTPNDGYKLAYILVDGQRVECSNNSYTFTAITEAHTIEAVFVKEVLDIMGISVAVNPYVTTYYETAAFNPNGLVLSVTYSDGSVEYVTYTAENAALFSFNPALGTLLATSDTSVTVTYGGFSAPIYITVNPIPAPYIPYVPAPVEQEPEKEPEAEPEAEEEIEAEPEAEPEQEPEEEPTEEPEPIEEPEEEPATEAAPVEDEIVNGEWIADEDGNPVFKADKIDADAEVYVDGELVDPMYYTINDDGTITFTPEFLAMLGAGEHDFTVLSAAGEISTTFTVNAADKTENPATGAVLPIMGIALASIATLISKKRK